MEIKFKKTHPDAKIPVPSKNGFFGFDLTAIDCETDSFFMNTYKTGISVDIPKGYIGILIPKENIYKTGQILNSINIIDSNFKDSISFIFRTVGCWETCYHIGDCIGKIVFLPALHVELIEDKE